MMSRSVLEIDSLNFGYTKSKLLFNGFSLSLKVGEIKAIVGGSGVGKSTLFELILGHQKPFRGLVKKGRVAEVFQDPYSSFHPSYTVIDQISDVASLEKLDELLPSLSMSRDLLLKLPRQLSGGQLQRASIIRALLMEPELLLLDEPTSALDNLIQLEVMKAIVAHGTKMGVLIITHDASLAKWCADEIVRL